MGCVANQVNTGEAQFVDVRGNFIYAACPKAGLKVLAAPSMVRADKRERGEPIAVPPAPRETPENHRVYRPGGQVWSVDFCGEYALVAAGMKGIRIVELWPEIREVSHVEEKRNEKSGRRFDRVIGNGRRAR